MAGIVIDGAIRDRAEIAELGAAGLPPRQLAASARAKNGPGALRRPGRASPGSRSSPATSSCADADGIAVIAGRGCRGGVRAAAGRARASASSEIVAELSARSDHRRDLRLQELP